MPPIEEGDVTDEDSGEEDGVNVGNLPRNQLLAEVLVRPENADEEDDMPLSSFTKRPRILEYTWEKRDLQESLADFKYESCGWDPSLAPLDLFSLFFDARLFEMLVSCSNKYAQQHNLLADIQVSEMKVFIGVLILSGYTNVSRRRMYWENEEDAQNLLVSKSITRNRFDHIFRVLHCCDNMQLNPNDRYAKVRPLFDMLLEKFLLFAPVVENYSVDEGMVPYFGRYPTKQFIRGKPIRWGYKFWIGTTPSGYIVWFDPYAGSKDYSRAIKKELPLGTKVVLDFSQALISRGLNLSYHLFFDNFFSSLQLFEELNILNLRGTGTVRENRLKNCSVRGSDKVLKKKGRGAYSFELCSELNLIVCKWHDNSIVNMISNCIPVHPTTAVKRFSRTEKKEVTVPQPKLVKIYNKNMEGVDRSDQNIGLYRIAIRGKKWYFSLFAHCIDMAISNASQLHKYNRGHLDNLEFRRRIARGLLGMYGKNNRPRNLKPSSAENQEIRFDQIQHMIVEQDKRTRCRICHTQATTRCEKCNVALHVRCFKQYHSPSF